MTAVIVPNILRRAIEKLLDEMEQANPHVGIFRESLYQDFLAFYDENGYLPSAEDVDFELASPEVTA